MPKRRANNEGTIYKRQDGRWVAAVVLPGGKRKSLYGKTRQEVAQKLTVALKTVQDGLPIASDQLTVERFLCDWLQSVQPGIRPSTHRRYEQLLRIYAVPVLGALRLSRLEPRHVQQLYTQCLAQGSAPATVRQLHAVLRRALGQAVKWGTLPRNVATVVTPPRVQRHDMTPLSTDQVKALLSAAHGERFEGLYVLAITTGMRLGELLGLRWQDVDLPGSTLHVRHTLVRTPTGWQLAEPKTDRSRRRITLGPRAIEALRHHRSRQAAERLRMGPIWQEQDLIFANEIGKPMDAGNLLHRSLWPLLQKAELPRFRFHDLRHTAATLLLGQGVHVKIVSELLGHSTVGLTLDVYSHVLPDMQQQAAVAMEKALQ
jgi:integrase